MPVTDGAALLSAAIRAACAAQAPRRTVAAVAAAIAPTVMRPVDAAAAQLPKQSPARPARTSYGEEVTETKLVERLRQSRADRPRIKRQHRRAAKSAAATAEQQEGKMNGRACKNRRDW